ncbi:MAG: class I SAM-dependent methyltransferase [Deltaproteobacteria bacterium]|nr:class I SAM-dependent methyltransferase [Deltaproteobacteria bacterium]
MLEYLSIPYSVCKQDDIEIKSFLDSQIGNQDLKTVASFGHEWKKFSSFSDEEIESCAKSYFDLVDDSMLSQDSLVLDVGCGSGRWAKYLSDKVKFIEAIDPSEAVFSAKSELDKSGVKNVRFTQAEVERMPFANNSFDFVMSLGVLHHIPRTEDAVKKCVTKLKPGGWFLVYLYFNLDNRPWWYKNLLSFVTVFRNRISDFPPKSKKIACEIIAAIVYWPMASFCRALSHIPKMDSYMGKIPLSSYRDKSFKIMRNDSLDRFGTPLEKRFSQLEIRSMLENAGLTNICFSEHSPYWHAVAQKPNV